MDVACLSCSLSRTWTNLLLLLLRYALVGYCSSSIGALFCGGLVNALLGPSVGYTRPQAYQAVMVLYSLICIVPLLLFTTLTLSVEVPSARIKAGPVANFLGLHQSR